MLAAIGRRAAGTVHRTVDLEIDRQAAVKASPPNLPDALTDVVRERYNRVTVQHKVRCPKPTQPESSGRPIALALARLKALHGPAESANKNNQRRSGRAPQ